MIHYDGNADRPLTWDDFKAKPIEGIGYTGEAMCQIPANFRKANAFQEPKFEVYAIFDRKISWVNPEAKSDAGLRYFHVMFNLFEAHARKLRKQISETKFATDPSKQFYEMHSQCLTELGAEFGQFRSETKLGQDAKQLSMWDEKVKGQLAELEAF